MQSRTFDPLDPFLGILMLDTTFPRIRGDIGNPQTFCFPVQYQRVTGATPGRVVINPDRSLIKPFIEAGQRLISKGAVALATSCGFLALFHQTLVDALPVPVFSSSLLQVHLARTLLKADQKVGILTASKPSLSRDHLAAIGIEKIPMVIQGMEHSPEFTRVFIHGRTSLDVSVCTKEMESAALELVTHHPEVGPIVLECTNMPPYADAIRRLTKRPVFDITTLLNTAWSSMNSLPNP